MSTVTESDKNLLQSQSQTLKKSNFSIDFLLRKESEAPKSKFSQNEDFVQISRKYFQNEAVDKFSCPKFESENEDEEEDESEELEISPSTSPNFENSTKFYNVSTNNNEPLSPYSWLSCTRFKPPKIARSKRRLGMKRYGRGPRIPFAPHQIAVLESTFTKYQYLSSDCINRLAETLHLSETRVKIWFQNRRARFRREKEALAHSSSSNNNEMSEFTHAYQSQTPYINNSTSQQILQNPHFETNPSIIPTFEHGNFANFGNFSNFSNLAHKNEAQNTEGFGNFSPLFRGSSNSTMISDIISNQLQHFKRVQEYLLLQKQESENFSNDEKQSDA